MLAAGAVVGLGMAVLIVTVYFSPKHTDVGYAPEQPVPYSHKLHAGMLGFDCRYCHQNVEDGAHATVPSTETCLNCHLANRVKGDSPRLAKVRESGVTGEPIEWIKVHMLPDYVYFDHSVHITAGGGCVHCHGRIDKMEVVRQAEPLSMSWCLDCHLSDSLETKLRPPHQVTDMAYDHSTPEAIAAGKALVKKIKDANPNNPPIHCGACHR